MNQGGWWFDETHHWPDGTKWGIDWAKGYAPAPKIPTRAPSRLADFHALDPSAQRAILEIEVGL